MASIFNHFTLKKVMCYFLAMAFFIQIPMSSYAQTIDNDTIEIVSETENEDGSLLVVVNDSGEIKELTFYPAGIVNGNARMSWVGWGSGSTSYYNATAEQTIQSMTSGVMATFLTANFGLAWSIASSIAGSLINAAYSGQRTIWLGRTTWLKNDYSAYRRQDTYYSDGNYQSVMYTDSIREYIGGNR